MLGSDYMAYLYYKCDDNRVNIADGGLSDIS